MTSLFDKLNLRPAERRLVVIVGIVVFVVLNLWLVIPHFGDLRKVQKEMVETRKKLDLFQTEIKKEPEYSRQRTELAQKGGVVAKDAQALELHREVSSQAIASGVNLPDINSSQRALNTRSNAFFDEQSLTARIDTGEKELVDFLYNLAQQNALIRVRTMDLRPANPPYRLVGSITFVASYQKKPPAKPTTAATAASLRTTAAPKPTASPTPAAKPPAKPSTPPPSPAARPTPPPKETAAKDKPAKPGSSPQPTENPRLRELPRRAPVVPAPK